MAFKFKNGSPIKKSNKAKYIFTGVFALVLFLVSASVIPFFMLEGNLPCADLLICLVCAVCPYFTLKESCVTALICGFLADLFLYPPTSFSPVVYVAAVVVTGYFLRRFRASTSVSMAVCSLCAIFIRCAVETVGALSVTEGVSLWDILSSYTLPMVLINFASAIVICFIAKRFFRLLGVSMI